MEVYYDTEFIDTGSVVHLLSIGMVTENGKEYYAINNDPRILRLAAMNPWLKENVLAYFPLATPIDINSPYWDDSHEDFHYVKNVRQIAKEVHQFILDVPNPSLWAWFSAYDHLMLSQLYGKMIDMPPGIPQRTNDVAQEAERLGNVKLPRIYGKYEHNALYDAWDVKYKREWLQAYEIEKSNQWLKLKSGS